MTEKICPCCGNRKGCDCYSNQSPQFRRIGMLEALVDRSYYSQWLSEAEAHAETKRELVEEGALLDVFNDQRLCLMHIPEGEALRPCWIICTYDEEFGPGDPIASGETARVAIDAARERKDV